LVHRVAGSAGALLRQSAATDAVDVVLAVGRQVVVDDEGELLDASTPRAKRSVVMSTQVEAVEVLQEDLPLLLFRGSLHGWAMLGEHVDLFLASGQILSKARPDAFFERGHVLANVRAARVII